jgi:hypothetical protein
MLARRVLVLDGLLQPLVPIFDQILTKTIEMPLWWSELPLSLGNDNNCLHHPLGSSFRSMY